MGIKLINNHNRIVNLGCKEGISVVLPPKSTVELDTKTQKLFHAELLHYVGNNIIQSQKVGGSNVSKDVVKEDKVVVDEEPKRARRRRRKSKE